LARNAREKSGIWNIRRNLKFNSFAWGVLAGIFLDEFAREWDRLKSANS